jgi:hypothetical protein
MADDKTCQKCRQRPFTKMILLDGVIPKFVCDECDEDIQSKGI